MIYVDTSVALAHILDEPRAPTDEFWREPLTSSQLLEYEIWSRLHVMGIGRQKGTDARTLLRKVDLIELTPPVLARALEPFPVSVRTLDALHLASADYLRRQGETIELASYDKRLLAGAQAMNIPICPIQREAPGPHR